MHEVLYVGTVRHMHGRSVCMTPTTNKGTKTFLSVGSGINAAAWRDNDKKGIEG